MSETALRNTDIDAALEEAKEAYVASNPLSLARYVEATAVMPGGNTRTVLHYAPFPLAMARAAGCRLWDADGAEYVDFLGEYTAGIYGHSHPAIRAALNRALDGGINYGASNLTEARFARAVCERFGLERVRFTNSGTEANLLAISLARIATGRHKVLVFDGGYHGAVFGFAGGGSPINAPFPYVVAPYNDLDATRALIEQHADDLALVILEPMIGSGGCIPATADFLTMLRVETTRVGALLILDEVMTSRLSPGGLQAVRGIKPDLTTLGKYIGGGMSFGAFGGRADLIDRFDPRRADALPHAGTFKKSDAPAHDNHEQERLVLEFQMPIPCERHEHIRADQQHDGQPAGLGKVVHKLIKSQRFIAWISYVREMLFGLLRQKHFHIQE